MNIVILRGNLTRDPELRTLDSGGRSTSVVNFTVAVSREFTRANGVKDKVTSFIACEAWDTGAEMISESFRKGDLVMVEGSLKNDSWEKDGVKHTTMKIRVNNFSKIIKLRSSKQEEKTSTSNSNQEELVSF